MFHIKIALNVFYPQFLNQSRTLSHMHQVAWKQKRPSKSAPLPFIQLKKQVISRLVCQSAFILWTGMPSGAMICMTATGQARYLGSLCQNVLFEKFSSREVAFKDLDIFHLTLHSLRIEPQINIRLWFFYDPEVEFFTMFATCLRHLSSKGRTKGLWGKHRSWFQLIVCFWW